MTLSLISAVQSREVVTRAHPLGQIQLSHSRASVQTACGHTERVCSVDAVIWDIPMRDVREERRRE